MDGREGESAVRPRRSKALTGEPIYKVTRRSMKHAGVVFVVGERETEMAFYANRGKHMKVLPPVYIGFVASIRRKVETAFYPSRTTGEGV